MTDVLHSSSSSSSSSSPSISSPIHNPTLFNQNESRVTEEEGEIGVRENEGSEHLSLLALLMTLFRKSFMVACNKDSVMEIGWPSDVEHVNHVTFDRFDGFLGLPDEFEPEVPRRAPSASATVFGVSTDSMQLSYDARGNIIPTILLLMQRHLYSQGGLQVEGIFRITAGNSQEEFVRNELNRGVIPQGIDVHCLAGLIKAWFRELPRGVLDSLSPEQVMQCQTENDCYALVRLLPPTEAALLDWVVNLMADVVQEEHHNKMNARNIAVVFAPNMTKMDDPLTALMYAVQVMNFLKTLTEKVLRERKDSIIEQTPVPQTEPSDDHGNQSSSSQLDQKNRAESNEETVHAFVTDTCWETSQSDNEDYLSYSTYTEEESDESEKTCAQVYNQFGNSVRSKTDRSSDSNNTKCESKIDCRQDADLAMEIDYKSNKGIRRV